jgi:hypothetical protein
VEGLRTEKWLNVDDFEKALAVARKRFPEPARNAASPQDKAAPLEEIAPDIKETNSKQSSKQPPKLVAPAFDMRIESWPARFVRQWRIRIRR